MNKLKVKSLIDKFDFKILANENAVNNNIHFIELNRVAFELIGVYLYNPIKSIIYFGNKEDKFLKDLDEKTFCERLNGLFKLSPPLLIIGRNFTLDNQVLKIIEKYPNIVVVKTNFTYSELSFTLSHYMVQEMIEYKMHHGCLVEVYGVGVFIVGPSGVGKTEIMIELIKKGHIFVADDSVDIARVGTSLLAKPSNLTKDFIEVRGLGILNSKKTFGYNKCIESTNIELIIELVSEKNIKHERIKNNLKKKIEGVSVACYKIPMMPGRNVSDIIESAVTDYKMLLDGYNSRVELENRLKQNKGFKNE